MIDLHTHILPGVDDGVASDEEAIAFARMAERDGVRTIVATPHCKEGFYVNERDGVVAGVERLRGVLRDAGVGVDVLPGAEVHLAPELVERVSDGRAPTLADNGVTLLLELSLTQHQADIDAVVFQLRLAGLQVLMAHPERIRYFQDAPARYEALVAQGAWGQVTTGSILGLFGEDARAYTERLLVDGLAHVIASDAHNTRGRPPVLGEAVEAVIPLVGEARARAMVEEGPAALLEGREPDLPPVEPPRRRSFIGRLLGR